VGTEIEGLEVERGRLYEELSQVGDFRRGSMAETYRRCGKANCVCGMGDHPGHGPRYLVMTKVEGRSRAQDVPAGPELTKVRRELANHQRFRALVQQVVEVNEAICQERPVDATEESSERRTLKKKLPRSPRRKRRAKPSG